MLIGEGDPNHFTRKTQKIVAVWNVSHWYQTQKREVKVAQHWPADDETFFSYPSVVWCETAVDKWTHIDSQLRWGHEKHILEFLSTFFFAELECYLLEEMSRIWDVVFVRLLKRNLTNFTCDLVFAPQDRSMGENFLWIFFLFWFGKILSHAQSGESVKLLSKEFHSCKRRRNTTCFQHSRKKSLMCATHLGLLTFVVD